MMTSGDFYEYYYFYFLELHLSGFDVVKDIRNLILLVKTEQGHFAFVSIKALASF